LAEAIGFSRARALSALAAVEERLQSYHAANHAIGVSPHAPYTVSPTLVRMLVLLARRQQVPVAMHLAECEEELQLMLDGTGSLRELLESRSMWDGTAIPAGTRPLDYMRILADAPRSLVIHGNYLDHAEYAFLAERADRMWLVYCPRTHAYFAHPKYPLAALLDGGVRVALGTDSRASNPDLNMLAEMRHAARAHPDVSPDAILRMATLNAAEALGIAADCGSITPGKLACFIAIPIPTGAKSVLGRQESFLTDDAAPTTCWFRGQPV
jgi:cytosine/adenosine deaminase-related metal-dependent hydrolase